MWLMARVLSLPRCPFPFCPALSAAVLPGMVPLFCAFLPNRQPPAAASVLRQEVS